MLPTPGGAFGTGTSRNKEVELLSEVIARMSNDERHFAHKSTYPNDWEERV